MIARKTYDRRAAKRAGKAGVPRVVVTGQQGVGQTYVRVFNSCASRGLGELHSAVQPPSTTSELPVIKALASLAKNKMGPVKS